MSKKDRKTEESSDPIQQDSLISSDPIQQDSSDPIQQK
jgi:hypothetical protein